MLDAWVSKYIRFAQEALNRLPIAKERDIYVPLPASIDGDQVEDLEPDSLRSIFSRDVIMLRIFGEVGSGKTALACQIARWAMSSQPQSRLADHLMLPVFIEQDVANQSGNEVPSLFVAIERRLRSLIRDNPGKRHLLRQLLKRRRLLVVIDGLSDINESTRNAILNEIVDLPINAVVLTSDTYSQAYGLSEISIKPLGVSGSRLLSFLNSYLEARGKRDLFNDVEFFEARQDLSLLTKDRDVTALLVKLYAEQMIASKEDGTDRRSPKNVPDLMLSYINNLSREARPGDPNIRAIQRAAKLIAWECLKEGLMPRPAKRDDVLLKLGGEENIVILEHVERRLGLIQTIGSDQNGIRFLLEPLAEYLAAMYLVDENGDNWPSWRGFLARLDDEHPIPKSVTTFLLAIRDCCLARAPVSQVLMTVIQELERHISDVSGEPYSGIEKAQFPLPIPPKELVDACASNECVLYGGSGLAARAGFPVWDEFLSGLIKWSVTGAYLDRDKSAAFQESLHAGQADAVSDSIYNELQKKAALGKLDDYLRDVFLRDANLPDVYQIIKTMPLAAVLTPNFDELFEKTYGTQRQVLIPNDAEQLKSALSKYQFFILKLYGSLARPEKLMVAPAQFEEAVAKNRTFSEFMEILFFSKTILFLGASLEGIEAYLKGITLPQSIPRKHYALVAVVGNAWQAQADVLDRRYGIQILPYRPSSHYPEVREFLEMLAARVAGKTTSIQVTHSKARLRRVVLRNVGPFDHLELDLDSRWNILLGDNGVGKSTILKAIALAICGNDGQQYSKPLIKSGRTDASIVLETDRNTVYETQIDARGEIKSLPGRPLEIENWLVIGFPPLRTASWVRPTSPNVVPAIRSTPSADDILPLLRGGLDPRMDELKNWIVDLDYRKKSGEGSTALHYDELVQEFFSLINYLTNLKLTYMGIDPTYGIRVGTSDGEIPIELLSQGTTSLTGWVGILLRRLNEVYAHDDDPKSQYALVLMDEIDAHMHPAWQQTLVHLLSDKFKGLQVITTTHSPLMVSGMRPRQLFRFLRKRDGQVTEVEVDREMALGRTDQVLTNDLFGLDTTVDLVTQERITEYQELLSTSTESRTKEQDLKLRRLRQIIGFRILNTGETAPERRAQELLQSLLLEQFGDRFPEIQEQILDRGKRLFAELKKQEELRQ